jgi:hypothetical protein
MLLVLYHKKAAADFSLLSSSENRVICPIPGSFAHYIASLLPCQENLRKLFFAGRRRWKGISLFNFRGN